MYICVYSMYICTVYGAACACAFASFSSGMSIFRYVLNRLHFGLHPVRGKTMMMFENDDNDDNDDDEGTMMTKEEMVAMMSSLKADEISTLNDEVWGEYKESDGHE